MNLVNQLHKKARKNYQSQLADAETALDSVKSNLAMEDENDIGMLKYFGTDGVITEQSDTIKKVNKMMIGEYVTERDIKSICLSYNLRFLGARYYKKEIPLKVLNDLKNFQKENNISDNDLQCGLMVIAPKTHFSLGPRPPKDPILIYKKRGDQFKVISKWGNDFNFLRRISGFFASNWIAVVIVSSVVLYNAFCTYLTIAYENGGAWFICNLVLAFLLALIFAGPWDNDPETLRSKWDTPFD